MEVTDRWAIIYYEWCLIRTKEEFEAEFPFLSLVCGRNTFKLIEYAGSLTTDERQRLAVALVKRFNERAVELSGAAIDAEEHRLIDGYLDYDIRLTEAGKRRMLPFASEAERRVSEQLRSGSELKGRASLVRRAMSERLGRKLGVPTAKPSGTQVYVTEIPGWRLRTVIDYGGSYGQITYAHTIASISGRPSLLQPPIHICGCMGVAGQTSWDLYTAEDGDHVADSIYRVICWFVDQWRSLTGYLEADRAPSRTHQISE